jgi:hypothetical protein
MEVDNAKVGLRQASKIEEDRGIPQAWTSLPNKLISTRTPLH